MDKGYTKKQLQDLAIEESKSATDYKKHHLFSIAKDEQRHSSFLKMLANKKR